MAIESDGSAPDAFDAMFAEAVARGEARKKHAPFAASVAYRPEEHAYFIRLTSGESFGIPVAKIHELASATAGQLARVEPIAQGDGIRWPDLDLDISTLTLVNRAFGEMIRGALGQRAGSTKSPAKSEAARLNGSKGGRPKGAKTKAPRRPPAQA